MKHRKLLLVSIMTIGLLILGSQSAVVAQGGGPPDNPGKPEQPSGGSYEIDTGTVTIKVVGGENVPMYQFWETGQNDTKYRLQFKQVFEFYDNNSNGVYDPDDDKKVSGPPYALASLKWEFSNVTEDDDGTTHFNITSSDDLFTFANHIGENASSLKFDVIINEAFEFKSNESLLALTFQLTKNNAEAEEAAQDGNRVSFDDAFFEIEDTATDDEGTIGVGLSSSVEENSTLAYVAYEQFTGEMVHDPTVGVQASSSVDDGTDDSIEDEDTGPALASDEIQISWDPEISKGDLGVSLMFASLIAVVIPVVIVRMRRSN